LGLDTALVGDESPACGLMALARGCRSHRRHCLTFYSHLDEGWSPMALSFDPPTRGKGAVVSKSAQSLSRNWAPPGRFPSSNGWSKARSVSVPIAASTSMTCAVGAVLPPLPGLVLFTLGMFLVCLLLVGRMEPLIVRVVYGGAPLTAEDHHALGPVLAVLSSNGLGPPTVRYWVRHGSPSDGPSTVGRRSVVVSRGLIAAISSGVVGVERAATLLAQAAGLVRGGATRGDLIIRFWTLPWVLLTYGMVRAARGFGVLPLVRLTWRARWLLTVAAAAQAMVESHVALACLVVGVGAISYLWPRWVRAWQTECQVLGDEAAAALRSSMPGAGEALGREDRDGQEAGLVGRATAAHYRHLSVVR
jgi:hypothetical protein